MRIKLKTIITVFIVLLISMKTFAIIVNDNDTSAFLTKAEFDSIKNDIQNQMDQYNAIMDSKIDGAIATYLAGIKLDKQQKLKSLINELNLGFVSSDKIDFPATNVGTYKRYYINLGIAKCRVNAANTMAQVQYLTGGSNAPAWKTVNSTDIGIFLLGSVSESGNYIVEKYITSKPFAAVVGIQTSGSYTSSGTSVTIPSKTFVNESTEAFLSSSDTWNLTCGGSHNIAVVRSFGVQDEYKTLSLNLLTGKAINNNDEYFVKTLEINKPSISNYTDVSPDFFGYEIQPNVGWTSSANRNTKLRVYNHYYTTIKKTNIINQKITGLMGSDIFYYNGCPMFTSVSKAGRVKLKFTVTNAGHYPTVFKIQDSKFDNTTISETDAKTVGYKYGDIIKVDDQTEVTLEFAVTPSTTYWIKARPIYTPSGSNTDLTYPSYITTSQILFTEEE